MKVGKIKLKRIPRSALIKAKENEKQAKAKCMTREEKEKEDKKKKNDILQLASEVKDPSIEEELDALLGSD